MPIPLIDLPFPVDALEPVISAQTLSYHYGKHHKGYIDKVNAAVKGGALDGKSLEAIVAAARGNDAVLLNNAAQGWNHGFYWHSLSGKKTKPSGDLAAGIDETFGSPDALAKELAKRGAEHFASGWVWLAERGGKLSIEETHDGDTLADSGFNPLLVVDLWEHAYYLDYQNARSDYLRAVIEGRLNWDFAAENLARGIVWTYPG